MRYLVFNALPRLIKDSSQLTKVSLSFAFYLPIRRMLLKLGVSLDGIFLPVKLFGKTLMLPLLGIFDSSPLYEVSIEGGLGFLPSSSWVVVEVGANIGLSACIHGSLAVKHGGYIIAVEPNPYVLPYLVRNLSLCCGQNVKVFPVAVSDYVGWANFYLPKRHTSASLKDSVRSLDYKIVHVRVLRLRDIYNYVKKKLGRDTIDLLILDIPGGTYNVISGSKELFADHKIKRIKIDLFEYMVTKDYDELRQMINFLRDKGYNTEILRGTLYAQIQ